MIDHSTSIFADKKLDALIIEEGQLPRLLYLADVPVESSYHGSALIYRLLSKYPAERLRIIEGNLLLSQPQRRLINVKYEEFVQGSRRLLNTRFTQWYSSWLIRTASLRVGQISHLLRDFSPQAVLTVSHGFSFLTAARYASLRSLPLHLICHDDWPSVTNCLPVMKDWLHREFCRVYQMASSRMCVSPFMCKSYYERYGKEGQVLYPSRSDNQVKYQSPPERLSDTDHPFTVVFAGTINTSGYVKALKSLAIALEQVKGRLIIYGPSNTEDAKSLGLDRSNIILGGMLSSKDLMKKLRAEADLLFVPMSFDPADRINMIMGFPSKLTDYTAVGLPLLIYGPEYCSASKWAHENQGVAIVINSESPDKLAQAIQCLAINPNERLRLGQRALEVGNKYFSLESVYHIFNAALVC